MVLYNRGQHDTTKTKGTQHTKGGNDMTYKKMIEGIVGRSSCKWVEGFIKTEGAFALSEKVTLKMDDGTCYFESLISIIGSGSLVTPYYLVRGTVDEYGYVYSSVIYSGQTKDTVVWGSTQELRNIYKIKEFTI